MRNVRAVILLGLMLTGCGSSVTPTPSTDSRQLRGRDLYIVHGFLNNAGDTADLTATMSKGGLYGRVTNVAYPCSQSVRDSGRSLAELIRRTSDVSRGIDLIGHSMGGLVARWAIEMCGLSDSVHNLVTLGTPHQGATGAYLANALLNNPGQWQPTTWVESAAYYALGVAGYADALTDLLPGSSLIRQLNEPSHTSCDYFTIAGQVRQLAGMPVNVPTDLVVTTSNANWVGLANEAAHHKTYVTPSNHAGLIHDAKALRLVKTILWKERAGPVS